MEPRTREKILTEIRKAASLLGKDGGRADRLLLAIIREDLDDLEEIG